MILGQGLDLVYLEDFSELFQDPASCFEEAHFSAEERRWARESPSGDPIRHLGARYAAKEAAIKALDHACAQRGLASPFQARPAEVEVLRDGSGRPALQLHGRMDQLAEQLGVDRAHLTLSHDGPCAVALVTLERLGRSGEVA